MGKQKAITMQDRRILAERWANGENATAIATDLGFSAAAIYVYSNLAGTEMTVYDEQGNPKSIYLAKVNERVRKDGAQNSHKVIDKIARYRGDNIKALATVHLSELLETSKHENTTSEHSHQWLDENGWEHRKTYIQDRSGNIYEATLNIANSRERRVLYDINNVRLIDKKRAARGAVPSTNHGRGSLTKGNSSESIVADPGENVKERFSYAGENANNADMDALARAKEMQAAGVADETIRQQTGWHTGMDGKWRWEIDDSGMRYDSSGDLRGSESAKWARDVAQRREFNARQRRETIPNRGNDRTVFAEETGLSPDMDNQGEVEQIGKADIKAIQSIGRMSVNQFSQADKRATERFARMYWRDIGAKSPFFRTWFGDWRGNDQTAVRVANQRGDSRGTCNNEDTGWNIQVSGKVFYETRNHSAKKNRSAQSYLPYINDIVKKAILLDSFAMDLGKEKSANSLMMHSLYAVADNGSGPNLIKLYVEEMYDPNQRGTAKRAYQLQNIEISSLTGDNNTKSSGLALASFETADVHTVADLFAAVKSRDESFRPNPQSQVVNEDGSPKIVYHGTNQNFNTFASQNGAYWFSESEDYAESMMEERGGGEVKQAYLNMRNPYRATLDPGRFSDPSYETPILRKAKAEGYDGVIIENSSKDPLVADTFYVVFDPRQIKSATDNAGTFDGMNPDIRYSVDDGGQDSAQQRINRLMELY